MEMIKLLKDDKIHYKRNMLISIIIGEVLVICAFIFSPMYSSPHKIILYDEPLFTADDIPQTVQRLPIKMQRPKIPAIHFSDEVEAFEILNDVSIVSKGAEENDNLSSVEMGNNDLQTGRLVPRLIYEVVPAEGENEFRGKLQLSLKINENGQVIEHKIISNSLDCTKCLNEIIQSAYKSKWEPAKVNGKNEDYWVVKSYMFN